MPKMKKIVNKETKQQTRGHRRAIPHTFRTSNIKTANPKIFRNETVNLYDACIIMYYNVNEII